MTTLITGGGGFLGQVVLRMLHERGEEVRSLTRTHSESLAALDVDQRLGDIAHADAVADALAGCDAVVHCAAKAGVWGSAESFWNANVVGTRNVIDACRKHGVANMVFTSSPSVIGHGGDLEGVDEAIPYPTSFMGEYPRTKAAAEKRVMAAADDELRTVSLRPHLIWGPGDNNVFPRVVARARAGTLRRPSGVNPRVDICYVDDAARAHLCALDRLRAGDEAAAAVSGKAFFITSDDPIDLWEMVDRMLAVAGLGPVEKQVPLPVAKVAAWASERLHALLRREGEPQMTTWMLHEFSTSRWFDISAARRDLRYEPQVSIDQGLERLREWYEREGA